MRKNSDKVKQSTENSQRKTVNDPFAMMLVLEAGRISRMYRFRQIHLDLDRDIMKVCESLCQVHDIFSVVH